VIGGENTVPFPPKVDTLIRGRFEELLAESEQLIQDMVATERNERQSLRASGVIVAYSMEVLTERYYAFRTRFVSLLQLLSFGNQSLLKMQEEVSQLNNIEENAKKLRGYLLALKSDYETGVLENLSQLIEATVTADYLGQAEQLLKEGQPGQYDHVPAAVLTGAILEDALRRLCQRQNPPIPVEKPSGEPKTLNTLIDDLKKANVYNELKAKQLRSWADIRNAAAHGEFRKFNRQDVEQMLVGVQNFLADYL
jgi:hypothetical protein